MQCIGVLGFNGEDLLIESLGFRGFRRDEVLKQLKVVQKNSTLQPLHHEG